MDWILYNTCSDLLHHQKWNILSEKSLTIVHANPWQQRSGGSPTWNIPEVAVSENGYTPK